MVHSGMGHVSLRSANRKWSVPLKLSDFHPSLSYAAGDNSEVSIGSTVISPDRAGWVRPVCAKVCFT